MARTFVNLWKRRQRVLRALVRDRERLAALSPGGTPAVDVRCELCGTPRALWFKLGSFDAN